jgi:hypothetical protein
MGGRYRKGNFGTAMVAEILRLSNDLFYDSEVAYGGKKVKY